ncbi:MAG: M28 family peptidase [Acidobacteria bacterium]|nr:M28 family peptidase [Acidobacteriota bacterium]
MMTKRIIAASLLLTFLLTALGAQDLTSKFDADKMRARVKKISSDEFEGRGPGTEGGRRAAQYIADEFKAMGAKPATRGSYFQNVRLVGAKADRATKLEVSKGSDKQSFSFGDDYVATTGAQTAESKVNAELVFVGYGIDAPLYKWNDYKGPASDYKGKVLMMLVNDPPATADEPDLFGAKALTYYGRWTYKYEEAARRGAVGVILIHTTESAGYGWNVVRTSNGNWRYEIARTPADKTPFLQFKAWASNEASTKILKQGGLDIDKLREAAKHRDFQPVKTGLTVGLDLKSEIKRVESPNIVATVEGSDPQLSKEYVVYSGHYDHFGIGEPDAKGDRIYNGAYDNASGVAAVLCIAEVLAKMPKADRPKRSTLFLIPTAEEQGLLGAEYYSSHPLVPLRNTVADINLDGVNIFGKVRDFTALGAERSSITDFIDAAAKERNFVMKPDAEPEKGFYFRSDHFPFAKVGVPSVNFQHGDQFIVPPNPEAASFAKDYTAKYYHQPSDEYHDWFDAAAMVQETEFALAFGNKIANSYAAPHYKPSDEFAAAEKKRLEGK